MSLTLVTAPEKSPLLVSDIRDQLKQSGVTADDGYLATFTLPAAVERGQAATHRQWMEATYRLTLDVFPDAPWIELPKPPLLTVVHVKYLDTAGVEQTWAASNYLVDAPAGPHCRRGRLALAYGCAWPTTHPVVNAVRITFTAGYGDESGDVPALLRLACLMDAATLYVQRDVAQGQIPVPAIYKHFRSYASQG